ncbi:hypothetical protein Trydic_g12311 [Trypoxylus dichotomus]
MVQQKTCTKRTEPTRRKLRADTIYISQETIKKDVPDHQQEAHIIPCYHLSSLSLVEITRKKRTGGEEEDEDEATSAVDGEDDHRHSTEDCLLDQTAQHLDEHLRQLDDDESDRSQYQASGIEAMLGQEEPNRKENRPA